MKNNVNANKRPSPFRLLIRGIVVCLVVVVALWCVLSCISHRTYNIDSDTPSLTKISVLTYNTHQMGKYAKPKQNRVIQYIQQTDADIVCLQEVEVHKDHHYLTLNELKRALKQYPYTYFDFSVYNSRRQYGNAVFSKYPLINKQTIRYDSRANISSRCDVVVASDTLRLFVNHLESNRLTDEDLEHDIDDLMNKLSSARQIRNQQARKVKDEVNASPYPVLVVGDLNSIPLSYAYQHLRWGLRDCFLQTSLGKLGFTFVKHHLGIRIDYILCSRSITPLSTDIDRVNYSDHYPMRSVIGIKKTNNQ
ncbi:MAG: endonuclease/exonuclease/phosphatase family protein [Paludibacteraceae bacterium]|nr:endonuclease/exonuclease/phosphatase family protein [Paludibacteraceae bacterium]